MIERRFAQKIILGGICAALVFAPLLILVAKAQTAQPQLLITWKAGDSYAPTSYVGKVLPNITSQITASVQAFSGGTPINLSGQTIYWYLDDNLLGGGVGAQQTTFQPYGTAPNTLTLRVEVPNYPGGLLIHEIDIPVVQPQAVIEAPYPQNQFSGTQVNLLAVPYFFATTSSDALAYSWSVNGQNTPGTENPNSLQVNMPASTDPGFSLGVLLTIQNPIDSSSATGQLNLTYEK